MVAEDGSFKYVKWHFKTDQGIKNFTAEEAGHLASQDPDYATRDLFGSIERGEYPSWSVYVQVMNPEDAQNYRFNPFDVTKIWSHKVIYFLFFFGWGFIMRKKKMSKYILITC